MNQSIGIAAITWTWSVFVTVLHLSAQTITPNQSHDYLAELAAASSALRLHETAEARRWLAQIPADARSWEWNFLNSRADSSQQTVTANGWAPVRLDLSPQQDQLVVACSDGYARILDTTTLQVSREIKLSDQMLYAVRFSSDGSRLVACARDGQLSCWDLASGKQLWSEKNGGAGLADLAVHPQSGQILFCSWYRGTAGVIGLISTWDIATGKQLWQTDFGVKPIVTCRYSPSGQLFAVGNWDAQVGLWDSTTHTALQQFDFSDRSQYSAIDDIAFSPDDKYLVAATKNGTPRVWSVDRSQPPIDMAGHANAVFSIAFSADGKSLFSGGSDGVIGVWSLARRSLVHRYYGHVNRVGSLVVANRSGQLFSASADNQIRRWDGQVANGYHSETASKYMYGMVVTDKDQILIGGGLSDSVVSVFDAQKKHLLREFAGTKGGINFLDDDGGQHIVGGNWDGDVFVWNWKTGQVDLQLGSKELGGIHQCLISNDHSWIAAATNKKQVVIWDGHSGDLKHTVPIPAGCWAMDKSSDGRSLVVGDDRGTVHWISTADGSIQWSLPTGASAIRTIQVARSGAWVALGDEAGQLIIIDVMQRAVRHLCQAHTERIWSLDISPDDQRLVTGSADHRVKTWDTATATPLLSIADFTDVVYTVRYSQDGRSIFVNCPGQGLFRLSAD